MALTYAVYFLSASKVKILIKNFQDLIAWLILTDLTMNIQCSSGLTVDHSVAITVDFHFD